MPASNSTVLPASGLASSARQARSMRFCASGGDHFSHIARGALPNIAPPSSFWLLPSRDQSFIAASSGMRHCIIAPIGSASAADQWNARCCCPSIEFVIRSGRVMRAIRQHFRTAPPDCADRCRLPACCCACPRTTVCRLPQVDSAALTVCPIACSAATVSASMRARLGGDRVRHPLVVDSAATRRPAARPGPRRSRGCPAAPG